MRTHFLRKPLMLLYSSSLALPDSHFFFYIGTGKIGSVQCLVPLSMSLIERYLFILVNLPFKLSIALAIKYYIVICDRIYKNRPYVHI